MKFLTIDECAEICSVSPETIEKWFCSGRLKGDRDPVSQTRKPTVSHLVQFMANHGLRVPNDLKNETN